LRAGGEGLWAFGSRADVDTPYKATIVINWPQDVMDCGAVGEVARWDDRGGSSLEKRVRVIEGHYRPHAAVGRGCVCCSRCRRSGAGGFGFYHDLVKELCPVACSCYRCEVESRGG
jgi:hypothetical protein